MILLFLAFHAAMLAGLTLLAGFWFSGCHRHLPNRVALPLLLGLPLAGWLLGTPIGGPLLLLVPASLGAAFAWSYRSVRLERRLALARRVENLLGAEKQIAEDSSNAGAYLARAELLEEEGRYDEARADYERAYGASERALSRFALRDHLDRLEHAQKAAAARAALGRSALSGALRESRVETALGGFGLLVCAASPVHGTALLSTALMLLWCRRLRRN